MAILGQAKDKVIEWINKTFAIVPKIAISILDSLKAISLLPILRIKQAYGSAHAWAIQCLYPTYEISVSRVTWFGKDYEPTKPIQGSPDISKVELENEPIKAEGTKELFWDLADRFGWCAGKLYFMTSEAIENPERVDSSVHVGWWYVRKSKGATTRYFVVVNDKLPHDYTLTTWRRISLLADGRLHRLDISPTGSMNTKIM